ncbi:hypothetical protein N9408_09290 [Opitutales bacterium]|nr:hypothetical protein [Opitutales bacterium]
MLLKKGRCFRPVSVFPMTGWSSDFTNIDFRIKIGRKWMTMISTIAIKNVECIHPIKVMLDQPSGKHIGDSRIKTGSKQCH